MSCPCPHPKRARVYRYPGGPRRWSCKLCGRLIQPMTAPAQRPRQLTDDDARAVAFKTLLEDPCTSNHELRKAVAEEGVYPKALTAFNKSVILPTRKRLGLVTERGKRARPRMPLDEWRRKWQDVEEVEG